MPLSTPIALTVWLFVIICAIADIRTRRIPNLLTGPALILGFALNSYSFGLSGVWVSAVGSIVLAALLIAPFALGGIGGGDLKMMAAVGALLGPELGVASLVVGMVLGGVIMLGYLAFRGRLREKLVATWSMVSAAVLTGSISPLRVSAEDPGAITLPYSVPLALGTIGVVVWQGL